MDDASHLLALKSCIKMEENGKQGKAMSMELSNMLLEFYDSLGHLNNATKIFGGIADEEKGAFCASSMIKTFISSELNIEASALYDAHRDMNNNVPHSLAHRACNAIHVHLVQSGNELDIEVLNAHGLLWTFWRCACGHEALQPCQHGENEKCDDGGLY